jgi:SAM-dependent methyltransferase
MHPESFQHLQDCVQEHLNEQIKTTIVDVGSMDVNGSYRSIFNCPQWQYIGLDVSNGKNVDIVLKKPYHFPLASHSTDVVISGQSFEHIDFFWITWMEMIRIVRPGGLIILAVPQNLLEHRYPVDCWRFFPDSMKAFAKYGKLILEKNYSYTYRIDPSPEWLVFTDTIGVFRKPRLNIWATIKQWLLIMGHRLIMPKR